MSLQVEKLEKNMAKLTIEVSAEELEKAIEGAYQKNKNKISIPGFRKGKAPRKMIEQMYGKSVFYEDAANALIPDAYDKALEECEEQIVSSPKIDVTQLEAGKPFIFTAEVALKPEVTLGKYKGVKVDKIEVKVTDEEVDAEINRERESNARTINVEDRAVKDGDMTVIDFEGFVDGVAFECLCSVCSRYRFNMEIPILIMPTLTAAFLLLRSPESYLNGHEYVLRIALNARHISMDSSELQDSFTENA